MELEGRWSPQDPETLESFQKLGEREQNAVRVALNGVRKWQISAQEPPRMRISQRSGAPFNLSGFADIMDQLGLGIWTSIQRGRDGSISFQPEPYTGISNNEDSPLSAITRTSISEVNRFRNAAKRNEFESGK